MRATIRRGDDLVARCMTLVGLVLAFVAICVRWTLGPPLEPVFFIGFGFLFVAPFFRSRAQLREATLELAPGRLMVKPIGKGRTETIAVKDLTGASTAASGEGVTLVLATDAKINPMLVSFDDVALANRARDALGVGKAGFGVLVWERGPLAIHHAIAAVRLAGILYTVGICAFALTNDSFAAQLDANSRLTGIAIGLLALVTLAGFVVPRRTITLRPDGIHLFEDRAQTYAWREIEGVALTADAIVLQVNRQRPDRRFPMRFEVAIRFASTSRLRDGLDEREAEAIVAQIRAATERSRGGPLAAPHFENVVGLLGPQGEESTREWIRRLDALADGWRVSPPRHGETEAYRAALWATLEDHDADPIVRALATRVLSRLDRDAVEPKLRVVLETIRDKKQVAHFRAALAPESEPLAAEIEKWKRRA